VLKFSRLADYALLVVHALGQGAQARMTATQVATHSDLPLPTVRKILSLLLIGGVVTSVPGVKGGYSLKRTLGEVTLLQVLRAIEGDWGITDCQQTSSHASDCLYKGNCHLKHSWSVVNSWLMQMLSQVTMTQMVDGLGEHPFNQILMSKLSEEAEA